MFRVLPLAGAAAIAFGTMAGSAQARNVTYEVNGQSYSYSTNNLAQTAAARRHIAAANAADAIKAKADAERAANPLVAIFGSSLQREAEKAQAALDQARPGNAPSQSPAPAPGDRPAGQAPIKAGLAKEPSIARTKTAPASSDQVSSDQVNSGQVKSVSFDAISGIKTTFMTDGTIHEEPFDGATLSSMTTGPAAGSSLNAFVERMRPLAPMEATGSIGAETSLGILLKPKP